MSLLMLVLLVGLYGTVVLPVHAQVTDDSNVPVRKGLMGRLFDAILRYWPDLAGYAEPSVMCVCNLATPGVKISHPQMTCITCAMPFADRRGACRQACQAFLHKTQTRSNRSMDGNFGELNSRGDRSSEDFWAFYVWKICRDNNNTSTMLAEISYWIRSDVEGCGTTTAYQVGTAVIQCTRPKGTLHTPTPAQGTVNMSCKCILGTDGYIHNEVISLKQTNCSQLETACADRCRPLLSNLHDSPRSNLYRTLCCLNPSLTDVGVSLNFAWGFQNGTECNNSPRYMDSTRLRCDSGNVNCNTVKV